MSQVPPNNQEAERALLGCILLGPSILPKLVADGLRARHFYRPAHGRVFEAMVALDERGEPPDVLLVTEELRRRGHADLDRAVHLLPHSVPVAGHWPRYARLVMDAAHLRKVLVLARAMQTALFESDQDGLNDAFDHLMRLGLPESWRNGKADSKVTPLRRTG